MSYLADLEPAVNMVIEKAKALINDSIKRRGHDRPPFLPYELAANVNIKKVERTDLGDLSAMLLKTNDGYIVKINNQHSVFRQNFSFAHEIGHILLGELELEPIIAKIEYRTSNPQINEMTKIRTKERLCDIAASELLMPEFSFIKYVRNFDISINSLEKLTRVFGSSLQSTAIRMAEISPIPCITLCWKIQKIGNSTRLKLDWSVGPGRNSLKHKPFKPVTDTAKPQSLLFQTVKDNNVVNSLKEFHTKDGVKKLHVESKGYGQGRERRIISLIKITNIIN
jgi:Zn-dependent peptidase ImmA (M78 family)